MDETDRIGDLNPFNGALLVHMGAHRFPVRRITHPSATSAEVAPGSITQTRMP
jgi:hypothetical protein